MAHYNDDEVKRAKKQAQTYLGNNPYKVVSYGLYGNTECWQGSLEDCQSWINCDVAEEKRELFGEGMYVEESTVEDALCAYGYGGFLGFKELMEKVSRGIESDRLKLAAAEELYPDYDVDEYGNVYRC